ncbi:hypothetical protein OU994_29715 [Pseudoduganella sp. SL102]|uniref:hypothetical protein n=1 Tax=Pseudoduganella sp. SL102 TaxID=2995154 RepID=UPI00248AFFF1|nr:hypothetical protein [Pseudoduganella sp. SL102]WBS02371.1 hypothetical protein OU994_29715 [Pseudoduganella sp. SL102]
MKIDLKKMAVEMALAKRRHKHQEELEAIRDAHLAEVRTIKFSALAKSKKKPRKTSRDEVYLAAIRTARTADDPHSILDALRKLAREPRPYPQLLDHVADEKLFKWEAGADQPPDMQSEKDALASIRRHLTKRSQ